MVIENFKDLFVTEQDKISLRHALREQEDHFCDSCKYKKTVVDHVEYWGRGVDRTTEDCDEANFIPWSEFCPRHEDYEYVVDMLEAVEDDLRVIRRRRRLDELAGKTADQVTV